MFGTRRSSLQCLAFALTLHIAVIAGEFFKPFNVTYDHRALIIDGKRRMLNSAGIHYPAPLLRWGQMSSKLIHFGMDMNQSEDRCGRYDLVKFVKLVGSSGLYLHLRIGPYVCAEWNFGSHLPYSDYTSSGFPVWLRDMPGIVFRTDNAPFKDEMQRFVRKIVDLMREEMLFSWQVVRSLCCSSYGQKGKAYVKWAPKMATGLGAGVPWVMCKQVDAPGDVVNTCFLSFGISVSSCYHTCNEYYCDGYKPNSYKKPTIWTENWDGWYMEWGGTWPHRPAEDLAFAVARFFERGGSFQNYYISRAPKREVYRIPDDSVGEDESEHLATEDNLDLVRNITPEEFVGGTNFGRTAGGPNYITSYDYDAPIDEYGLLRQPRWGHLKDLHDATKLCEPALVAVDSPQYMKLGPKQEAHLYGTNVHSEGQTLNLSGNKSTCSAFLANIDEHNVAAVTFFGQVYTLPPWSVSILPDCRNTVFNTAKGGAQTSIKTTEFSSLLSTNVSVLRQLPSQDEVTYISKTWLTVKRANWCLGAAGHWVKVDQPVQLKQGYNDLVLLSETIGLQILAFASSRKNYGAFLEKDWVGFKCPIKLTGFRNGDIDLSNSLWTY
ncbi:hypothetical protein HYC85_019604 [Camellia sinensis]|uniref:beta-galactosidase n=1 Tax=Camellia sinensis TaxID=4442 RepID=A0A7J7GMD6_CAMSI|nr:hypothetical protein HYC85_019604 [Camellia sinensis]